MPPPHGFNSQATRFDHDNALLLLHCAITIYDRFEDSQASHDQLVAKLQNWGFPHVRLINRDAPLRLDDVQASIAGNDSDVVIAFRGSERVEDWLTDIWFRKKPGPWGNVHAGFLRSWRLIKDELKGHLQQFRNHNQKVWITGHSLGGAMAVVAAASLHQERACPVNGVYTFGQPRVGDWEFLRAYHQSPLAKCTYRVVNDDDKVTRVPPQELGFHHVGQLWYINRNNELNMIPEGFWRGNDQPFKDVPDYSDWNPFDDITDHFKNNYLENLQEATAKAAAARQT